MVNEQNLATQFLNQYKGTVKPIKRRMSAHPVIDRHIIIGQSGDLFTKARLWIYEPTTNYPEISIFLQLKNASGSAFTKLNVNDVEEFRDAIAQWVKDIQAVMPVLQAKMAQVNAYIDNYNQYSDMVNTLVNNQVNNEETQEEEEPESPKKRR